MNPPPAGGGAAGPDASRPELPRTVLFAVRLMYAGAALTAIGLAVSLLSLNGLRAAIIAGSKKHLTDAQVTGTEHAIVASAVISGLIGIGLWLLMARANADGRSWARIVASVLFGINTLGLVLNLAQAHTAAGLALTLVIWAAGLGAIILLWRPDSASHFQQPPVG